MESRDGMSAESSPHLTPRRQNLARISLAVSAGIIVFYFATLLAAGILLALRLPLNRLPLPAGIICGLGAVAVFCRSSPTGQRARSFKLAVAVLVGVCLICGLLAMLFYDITYDGQAYHQEAIIQLAEGWNPLRGDLGPDAVPSDEVRPLVNGLARGPEMVEAAIYVWAQRIELGKMLNMLVLAASLLAALAALLAFERIGTRWAVYLGITLALNPVCIYQAFSYYVDGQLASLLLCLMAFLVLYVRSEQRRFAALALATIAILINVKFTAIGFAGAYVAAGVLWLLWDRRYKLAVDAALAGVAALVIGLFIGTGPYLTNTLRHGHPLYPLAGPQSIQHDWNRDRPVNFNSMDRIQRLLHSLASLPEDEIKDGHFTASRLTVPMYFGAFWRLGYYGYPDTRVAGFGPFFGGALLLALAAVLLARPGRSLAWATAFITLAVLCSALMHPEAWWARYCPHIYGVPFVLLVAAATSSRLATRRVAIAGIIVLAMNASLVIGCYVGAQVKWSIELRRQLRALRGESRPVMVQFKTFRSNRVRLREWGIDLVEVDSARKAPDDTEKLTGSNTLIFGLH